MNELDLELVRVVLRFVRGVFFALAIWQGAHELSQWHDLVKVMVEHDDVQSKGATVKVFAGEDSAAGPTIGMSFGNSPVCRYHKFDHDPDGHISGEGDTWQ